MRALVVQPSGYLQAIYRVNPLKHFGYVTCLVRLNPTDEMPGDAQGFELRELSGRLLDEVLAEVPQPGLVGRPDGRDGLLLADGQDRDVGDGPPGRRLRKPDPFECFCDVVRDLSHVLNWPLPIVCTAYGKPVSEARV